MKVLITGAAGFIGQNLLAEFEKNGTKNSVLAVSRRLPNQTPANIEWLIADLNEHDWTTKLPKAGIDTVIHLAQSKNYREFPEKFDDIFSVNVKATVDLAKWALNSGVKHFVFASTGNVYGSNDSIFHESDTCNPDSMYGASKLSTEILLKPFAQYLDITILRLFGVYGPGQRNAMLPSVIQRFIRGDEITLAGNIGVRFNPIYITDCVSIIRKLVEQESNSSYEIINVGGPETINLKLMTNYLELISGKVASVRETSEEPKYLVCAIDKLKNTLHHKSFVTFKDGLQKTFEAIRSLEQ